MPRDEAGPLAWTATFQMYADVDAEGDLGSNYGAVSVKMLPSTGDLGYLVKFNKPIGHCAAVAQSGRAGGSDDSEMLASSVVNAGPNTFQVKFGLLNSSGFQTDAEPFMMMVTCRS